MKIYPYNYAFPFIENVTAAESVNPGLSIRAELAARFMAAMIGNVETMKEVASRLSTDGKYAHINDVFEILAGRSLTAADFLIKGLNENENT